MNTIFSPLPSLLSLAKKSYGQIGDFLLSVALRITVYYVIWLGLWLPNFNFSPFKFGNWWWSVLIQKRREDGFKHEPKANKKTVALTTV